MPRHDLPDDNMRVCARAWIERGGLPLLGPGRADLLRAVAAHGSISAAARELGVTYRTAWRWIDRMNEVAGRPLVSTITGGQGGGGATLTSAGFAALEALDDLTVELERFTATMTARLMKRLG